MVVSDGLIIGYDETNGIDRSVLMVIRKTDTGFDIINELVDKEAEEVYRKLIGDKH